MNKKTLIIIGTILLAVVAGVFWYTASQSQRGIELTQNNAEVVEEQVHTQNSKKDMENIVKKDEAKKVSEKEQQNIKPEFGIDDSGLKYNKDGDVDMRKWKVSDTLIEFRYPDSWIRLDGIYNIASPDYPAPPGQISITMAGFGAPFDIDKNDDEKMDKLLVDAVNYAVNNTEQYVREHNGTCQKNETDKLNVYIKCKYKKDTKINILYERTFMHYNSQNGEKTGGSAGLNIEFGDTKTLENNKKVINQILKSAYIGQIIGKETFVLEDFYLK
jgi:hypothetical protein